MRRGLIEPATAAMIGTTDPTLAVSLELPLVTDASCDYLLESTESGLQLQILTNRNSRPLRIDFGDPVLRHRRRHPRQELLLRAIGGPKARGWTVVDMTAGLGQDAFIMAGYGLRVTMLERCAVLAALLDDGLARHHAEHPDLPLRVLHQDALSYVGPEGEPDIVYLDPMYPEGNKSALNKLSLRVLRDLAGDDPDADQLLGPARRLAKRRVVVKRPKHAPPLDQRAPNHSHRGKAVRWDVYLT